VAKKSAAPRAAALMSFAKRNQDAASEDRIVLFEVDGTEYTIPAVIPAGDALAHLLIVNTLATEAQRGAYLVREIAGPAALTALLGEAEMTSADWRNLIKILTEHVFGPLEAPGN
jgi:hypothetical protein